MNTYMSLCLSGYVDMYDYYCIWIVVVGNNKVLKGHCIEFKYYADGIHSGLTPLGINS